MKRLLSPLVLVVAMAAPGAAFAMASPQVAEAPDPEISWANNVVWDYSENDATAPKPAVETVIAAAPTPAPAPAEPPPQAQIRPEPKIISSAEAKSNIPPEWDKFYRQLADYCLRFPGECIDDSEYASVPEIYKFEALRRFAYSPNAVSFALTPHVIHTHHEHVPAASAQAWQSLGKIPTENEYKTINLNRVYDSEWEEDSLKAVLDRKGSIYAKPWDNFEPFDFKLSQVNFEGPYIDEMKLYTEDLNPDEEGVVRFKKRIPTEGFDVVRPITRPDAKAVVARAVGNAPPQEGKVVVYRKTMIKPIVNVGVYSE